MVQYAQPVNAMLAEDGLNLHTAQETGFSSFYRQQMLTDTESCCRISSSFKVITLILKLQKQKSPRKTSACFLSELGTAQAQRICQLTNYSVVCWQTLAGTSFPPCNLKAFYTT